jgi:serine/threonine protein kinase
LRHANLVEIVEYGRNDRTCFVASELIAGVSLRKLLQRSRPAPIPVVLAILTQLLDALVAARGAHGGVSPANVMIDTRGAVRLADVGIARVLAGAAPPSLARLGYLAPETAIDAVVDERSDLFSVGAITWELIAGRRLFDGSTPVAVIAQLGELRISPPSRHNATCDGALDRILLGALTRRPEDRPASSAAMRTTLELFPRGRIASPGDVLAWVDDPGADDDPVEFAIDNAHRRGDAPPIQARVPREAGGRDADLDDESKIIVIEHDRDADP